MPTIESRRETSQVNSLFDNSDIGEVQDQVESEFKVAFGLADLVANKHNQTLQKRLVESTFLMRLYV